MNAIILAAGMGTRLRPLTDQRPKALVEIAGESFFARQVRQLRAVGTKRITVVTGYRAEAFEPWRGDPGLEFVYNDRYADCNNLWSMHLVRDRLGDTYVLDGDLRLADGVIPSAAPSASGWFVGWREGMRGEWVVRTDEADRVKRIDVAGGSGWILTGLSYWASSDGRLLASLLETAVGETGWEELFWDEIPRRSLELIDARAFRLDEGAWAEIDSLEDKAALEARLSAAGARSPAPGDKQPALDAPSGRP